MEEKDPKHKKKRLELKRECQQLYHKIIVENSPDENERNRFFEILVELGRPAVAAKLNELRILSTEDGEDILSQSCMRLYAKGVLEKSLSYKEDSGYFADYAVGMMKMIALEHWRSRMRNGDPVDSVSVFPEKEGESPENFVVKREGDRMLVSSFLKHVVNAKTVPFQLLTMCYMKLQVLIRQSGTHYNCYHAVRKEMDHKTLRQLANRFLKNTSVSLPYMELVWGSDFETAMKGPYRKNKWDFVCLEKVVFDEKFSKKDMENWSERVFRKLATEWISRIEEEPGLADAAVEYVEKRNRRK